MLENPFQNRHMIKRREDFFGRKDEINEIISSLESLQSRSIIGERRIGKSSLLWHISQIGTENLGDEYKFYFHDLQDARYHTAISFFRKVLDDLGFNERVIKKDNTLNKNLVAFTNEIIKKKKQNIIFCFDEFEILFKHSNQFNDDFFDHIRSQINQELFSLVTSSKHNLQHLCLKGKLTSPFYNVFQPTKLKEFPNEEANEFIQHYFREGYVTKNNLRSIESYSDIHNNHPLKLQIICDNLFKNKIRNLSEDRLLTKINGEIDYLIVGKYSSKKWRSIVSALSLDNIKKLIDTIKSVKDAMKGKSDD